MFSKIIKKMPSLLRGIKSPTKYQAEIFFNSFLLKELINEINDAIFIINPATSKFLYVNDKACGNLGYSREELLKMGVVDIETTLPDDFSWQDHVKTLQKKGSLFSPGQHKRKDGTNFPIEVNIKHVSLGEDKYIVTIARDISDRKKYEEIILQEKNKLEAVVAALGDGLTFQDRDFTILYQNEIHQRAQGDHAGEKCYTSYHGRDAVCEGCLLARCFGDGKVHRRETEIKKPEGTVYFEVSASPIKDGTGEIIGGIETVRDITDRKLLEMQLQQTQKMEAIGTLAGGIAHDFNNILTSVIGNSEMAKFSIQDGTDPEEYLNEVIKAGTRATKLVKQILAFSHKKELQLQVFAPHSIIKEALKMLRSSIPATIDIQENIASDCGLIEADPTKIHQIVMNLCTNALHSIEDEKGTLSVSLRREKITAEQITEQDVSPGTFIVLSVSDTGHGINKETLERIYDPYFTTKEVGNGTGLGLAIVQRGVKDYKGFIRVESEPGKGANFQIYLPALAKNRAISGETEKGKQLPMGNERILVVDDEKTIANMHKAVLARLGYKVTAMTSSKDALEKFRSNPNQFDLIITDQTMPGLTGAELAQAALQLRPNLPIILCTGHSAVVTETDALEIGIKRYVLKPVAIEKLAKDVRILLDAD
jgi:PAS domain S-box-containing protein